MKWFYLIEGFALLGIGIYFLVLEERCSCYYYFAMSLTHLHAAACLDVIDWLKKDNNLK